MAYRERQKISQMTPKGANLAATDLIEVSELVSGTYQTKSITGQEIIDAASGGGTNIYNTDGTLTANRTLTGDNLVLLFQTMGQFNVHSHKNNTDNITFETRSDATYHSFAVKDHNTGEELFTIKNKNVTILKPKYTIELIDALTTDFYAPYNLSIDSVTNILNAPTTTIQDDGVAYTLGNTIASGSRITITVNTAAVVTLNATRL
jgi:hypothetical protein